MVVQEQAARGFLTDPQTVRDVEEYLDAWARYCELAPKEQPSLANQPAFITAELKKAGKPRSGHRPGRRYVSEKEAFFLQKLARARRNLDEIGQVLESFGSQLDASKPDEEVDATPAVDRVDELIWSYNNEIESARDAWLRDSLSGALNDRLLSLKTPLMYGLPWFTEAAQEQRAMLQGMQISRRLQGRNTVMDHIVTTMQTVELAGDVAGFTLGGGALIRIAKKGGKWAVVKTLAAGAAKEAAGRAAEKAIEQAGVDANTIGGAKLAAALVRVILRKRIKAASTTPAPQQTPPNPPTPPSAPPKPKKPPRKPKPKRSPPKPKAKKAPPKRSSSSIPANTQASTHPKAATRRRKPRLPPKGTPERTRIEAARKRGIHAAKERELQDIQAGGTGSDVWTKQELETIRSTGRFPKDVRWHHDPTVANRPDLADDPTIISPARGGTKGHLAKHFGDFRKPYPEDEE
jgi:outer membrane biosynthesis protein TonB